MTSLTASYTTIPSDLRSTFLQEIAARGFLQQATDVTGLDDALHSGPVAAYIGFDATADSLHVGSLVQIMLLRRLQQAGHRPIVLIGGGTTRIGDPSGRDRSRPVLSNEAIVRNMAGIRRVFSRFLTFGDGPTDAIMVNNAQWLDRLEHLPFLARIGRHFSVNRMLGMDAVRTRLEREEPLSFLEFSYMILQAYDFVELARRHGCMLQMGGSDQWGNIVNGVELARRVDGKALFGLVTPLIQTADGAKMGKTAEGAVWLDADRVSSQAYWQFWRNTRDEDVGRFLRLFTDLPLDEIARLAALRGAELNTAKKILASEATRLAHGDAATSEAEETARQTFEADAISEGLPTVDVDRGRLAEGIAIVELLASGQLVRSKAEARRLIEGGGARLNGAAIADGAALVTLADLDASGRARLSAGRKRHVVVRAV
jgi:tyrosyl-tRNA synthetase